MVVSTQSKRSGVEMGPGVEVVPDLGASLVLAPILVLDLVLILALALVPILALALVPILVQILVGGLAARAGTIIINLITTNWKDLEDYNRFKIYIML